MTTRIKEEEAELKKCLRLLGKTVEKLQKDENIEEDITNLLQIYNGFLTRDSKLDIPLDLVRHLDEGLHPDQFGQMQVWHRLTTLDQEKSKKMAFLKARDQLRSLKFGEK